MEKYIALQRGVIVGGNHMLPMAELKAAMTADGFTEVSTYIQSGNVIFSWEDAEAETLQTRIGALIETKYGFRVPVCVLSPKELHEALAAAPEWWNAGQDAKHNAIFVIPPATVEDVYAQVGQMKPEYERAAHHGRVIFWSAPMATYSRTRLSRVVGSKVYDSITIRNANTALKLCELTK
jgi:uncharacterized protein (DUF1697 family)